MAELVLELFAADEVSDVSLNQWLRRVPSEMLKAHLNIDKQMAATIPAEKLFLVSGRSIAKKALRVPGGKAWWSFKQREKFFELQCRKGDVVIVMEGVRCRQHE
jgi:hypothetical protein